MATDPETPERPEPEAPEETPTEAADTAEPAGEQDPGNEAEYEEAVERPDGFDGEAEASAVEAPRTVEQERDEYLDLARRTQAELENFRKRVARDQATTTARAKAGIVRELLPVVDNLERALGAAAEAEAGVSDGIRLVLSELAAVLERNGVSAFDPSGEPFDPTFHEAISTQPANGGDSGVVLNVVEKGYRAGETVLRPARVVVSG